MWTHSGSIGAFTNEVDMPTAGNVGVIFPEHTDIRAFVNNSEVPIHNFNVAQGDKVKFQLKSHTGSIPSTVSVTYNGAKHDLNVIPQEAPVSQVAAVAHATQSKKKHKKHKHKHSHGEHSHVHKGTEMDTSGLNLFTAPSTGGMAGAGAGLGAGVLGGILAGALFGNGAFGNRNGINGDGCVTPTQLQAGLAGVVETQQNNAVLQTLGDIKGSIPYAEGQSQLALAGAQSDITNLINAANVANLQGQFAINKNVSDTTAQIIATEVATADKIDTLQAANALGFANLASSGLQNSWAITQAINNDGDRTRSLIQSINQANLDRIITTQANEIIELRGDQKLTAATNGVAVNVTQNVNQQQMQLQAQQQYQTLANALATLVAQNQHISNGIVNLGTMTGSGNPTSANTRVNS